MLRQKILTAMIVVVTIFMTHSSYAQAVGSNGGSSRFYLTLAAKGGMTKVASADDKIVKSRDMLSFGGELNLGMRAFGFLLGASAEYLILGQRGEVNDVGGTNASGKQITFAPVFGIPLGNFALQMKPHFFSTYTIDKKTAAGDEVKYTSPKLPSFTTQLLYGFGRKFIGVEYTRLVYKERSQGANETTLDSNSKLIVGTIGLMYGYKF